MELCAMLPTGALSFFYYYSVRNLIFFPGNKPLYYYFFFQPNPAPALLSDEKLFKPVCNKFYNIFFQPAEKGSGSAVRRKFV